MIPKRLIVAVAVLAAVAAGGLGTFRSAAAAATPDKLIFSPSPIATAGSLSASATVPVTVTATIGGLPAFPANVWLSFTESGAATGGSATAGATSTLLTSTPQSFPTDASGVVNITYHAPATLPTSGHDSVTAQNLQTSPTVLKNDHYVFSPLATYVWSLTPIAPTGSLAASHSVGLTVTAEDGAGHGISGANILLSLTTTASSGGSATGTDSGGTSAITGTPTRFSADTAGSVTVTYTTPASLPNGGTDTLTAQDHAIATVTASTTYTFAGQLPGFRPQGVGQPAVALAADGTQIIFWQGAGGHLIEAWWNGSWNGPVDWTAANGWPASVSSAPSLALAPDGITQVIFWQGAGGHLIEAWWNGTWNGPVDWTAAKGWPASVSSAPNVTFASSTQIIFWKSAAGHLIEVWFNGSWNGPVDWTAAKGWGAPLTSAPSAAIDPSSGTQIIFWQGAGGHLIEVWFNGSWNGPVDWTAANGWGAPLTSAPSAAIRADHTQLIFWQGAGAHLIEVWWNGSWNGPVDWSS